MTIVFNVRRRGTRGSSPRVTSGSTASKRALAPRAVLEVVVCAVRRNREGRRVGPMGSVISVVAVVAVVAVGSVVAAVPIIVVPRPRRHGRRQQRNDGRRRR